MVAEFVPRERSAVTDVRPVAPNAAPALVTTAKRDTNAALTGVRPRDLSAVKVAGTVRLVSTV